MSERPMKWYKFLIYFSLIATAVCSFLNAVLYIVNSGRMSFPLSAVWLLCSILSVAEGILAVMTRQKLARREKIGIALFFGSYIFGMIISLIATIASNYTNPITIIVSIISSIIGGAIYLYLNKIYFEKRMDYFC